jgi:hypothetical protein
MPNVALFDNAEVKKTGDEDAIKEASKLNSTPRQQAAISIQAVSD